ncbi:uncharacterized protein [Montipora foliosa]|uniref:uncharacterized protein isoform X2 n=1 Tax=Montipora foliosa TaxID=591990 RepID=UPI0035F140A6
MSLFAFDPELEQKLNDIDEFIKAQCGDLSGGFDQSEWLLPSQAGDAPVHASSCNVKAESVLSESCGATTEDLIDSRATGDPGPEVKVQIMNLVDDYDNRTTKSAGRLYGYRMGSAEVTIVARAEEEIKRIRVYIQPCPETTAKTADTTGPAELRANLHSHDKSQTVLSVDLSTFHAEQEANAACRQGSVDILEANRWELVIIVSLRTGDISTIKSKPFRISTRLRQMARDTQQDNSDVFEEDLQKVPSQPCEIVSPNSVMDSNFPEKVDESLDTNTVVNRVASKLRQELARLHLRESFSSSTLFKTDPLILGKVVLRPDTTLDRKKVSDHYNRDVRARYVVEQPDLPVLLKLMSRTTTCTSGGRRRANGFKTAEEDFWWACGLCFFERRKKSTVKAHVAQRVCQKTSLRKEMRQRRKAMGHLKRYASCDFSSVERFDGFEQITWNSPLSV